MNNLLGPSFIEQGVFAASFRDALMAYLNSLERMALFVNVGSVNIGVVNSLIGDRIEDAYGRYAWYIRQRRRHHPDLYRQIEFFVDRLLRIRRAGYQITDHAVNAIAEDVSDDRVIERLQGLRNQGPFQRDKFERELHDRDIQEDKFVVFRRAYMDAFRIEPFDPQEAKATAEVGRFLSYIYENTDRSYPPVQSRGCVSCWADQQDEENGVTRFLAYARSGALRVPDHEKCVGHVSIADLNISRLSHWRDLFRELNRAIDAATPSVLPAPIAVAACDHPADDHRCEATEFYVIQELAVEHEWAFKSRSLLGIKAATYGLSRMLIRHALQHIEENLLPKELEERRRADPKCEKCESKRRIALVIVEYKGWGSNLDALYAKDGAEMLPTANDFLIVPLNGRDTKIAFFEFGHNKRGLLNL